MTKKVLSSLLLLVLLAGAILYIFWPKQKLSDIKPTNKPVYSLQQDQVDLLEDRIGSSANTSAIKSVDKLTDVDKDKTTVVQQIDDKREEISQLIAQLDQSIRNGENKGELENEMQRKISEYNKLALPYLVEKMNRD